MGDHALTDEQISDLSESQRRELIRRLSRPTDELMPPPGALRRIRTFRLTMLTAAAVALVPWTVYLAMTLPAHYEVGLWSVAWVGFDTILIVLLAATAILGRLHRQLMIPTAFASGVLLLCDAWFDVLLTDAPDRWLSVASLAVELPIAVFLVAGPLHMMRIMSARMWMADPRTPLWKIPLPRLDAMGR